MIFEELNRKKEEFKALEKELSSTELLSDKAMFRDKSRAYANLKEMVEEYNKYLELEKEKRSLEKIIEDEGASSEYAVMAKSEIEEVAKAIEGKHKQLEDMLLSGPSDELKRNVIMEIRAGTGGLEAGLFAADLFKMYTKYSVKNGWKVSVINMSESELGGIKEVVFSVEGEDVFKHLRFEMGIHRVQRVPETEASGRIHTSAVTVAVLPEAEDVDIEINPNDLKVDTYRASGAGGQHVNKTDSAIRITHVPSGLVVTCQDDRSQHKNRAKAMKVIRTKLLDMKVSEQASERAAARKKQVGSGDRSEKIRTYNFPENRVTDHRIKVSMHNLPVFLEGEIDDMVAALEEEEKRIKLQQVSQGGA
jgi:peptide chain release factor 1